MIRGQVNMRKALPRQIILIIVLLLCSLCYGSLAPAADDAATLRKQYVALLPQMSNNQFHRMLHLDSAESPSTLKGDIYAVANYPFASVNKALNDPKQGPANWCDLLILHLNNKYCRASSGSGGKRLSVNMGRKVEQPLADTYRVEFNHQVSAASPEYFHVNLNADSGPMGTRDYRIALEAVAIDGKRTFLHLSYSYRYGTAGRMVMETYLATLGSDKVGFTRTGILSNGQPGYIGGARGVVERNIMRYYLAIEAYLSALTLPADKGLEKRLSNWFSATEQYARQLHEVERQEYMQMKYKEYQRQQTVQ
jgi:hypothetical protein